MSCIEHTLPRHGWIFNRHRILWRINSKLAARPVEHSFGVQKTGWLAAATAFFFYKEWFAAFGFQKPRKADIMGMHLKKATIAKMLLVALNWSAYPVVAMASEAQHRNSTIMFPSKSSAWHIGNAGCIQKPRGSANIKNLHTSG